MIKAFRLKYLIIGGVLTGVVLFSVIINKTRFLKKTNFYYVPSFRYVKFISGTFYSLAAHLLFIKVALDYPEHIPNKADYIISLCRLIVSLDHHIREAFFFGGVVAPVTVEEVKKGIRFLKEGLITIPYDWKIPFWIGFNYLQIGDYEQAIEFYKYASNMPESPYFLKSNLPFLYYRSGNVREGINYLEGIFYSVKNPRLREIIKKKLQWLKDLSFLEKKVRYYRTLYHRWPRSLEELVEKGLIHNVPQDTFGRGFYLEFNKKGYPLVRSKF